tara:strand:+ start:492 stop:602 length:111 start_codon:yes stop_codon:yes gene_type:complete
MKRTLKDMCYKKIKKLVIVKIYHQIMELNDSKIFDE